MKKTNAFFALAIMLLLFAPQARADDLMQLDFSGKKAVIVAVSPDWHDAYLASILAQHYGMPVRFVQDMPQMQSLSDELDTGAFDTAIMLSKKGNELPSLAYRIRSANVNALEVQFSDYRELSKMVAEKIASEKSGIGYAIIVRDDFAFDALSAKYLSYVLDAPVLFAQKTGSLYPETLDAISSTKPGQVFLFGALGPGVQSSLSGVGTKTVGGRDEFETSRIAASLALDMAANRGKTIPRQAMITPGDILESSLLNSGNQPVLMVPYASTYSLLQLSQFVNETGMLLLVGIGQGVADSGSYVRQRTGVRVMVKLGRVRAQGNEQMNKQDIVSALEGYALPLPDYNGTLEITPTSFAETVGESPSLFFGAKKIAPPLVLHANYKNNGNIESPVSVLFSVVDKNGVQLARIESPEQNVAPGETKAFTAKWSDAPSEGAYDASVSATINIYDGLPVAVQKMQVEVRWFYVWFGLGALILLFALVSAAMYYSYRARENLMRVEKISGNVESELEKMSITLSKPAKEHAQEKEWEKKRKTKRE